MKKTLNIGLKKKSTTTVQQFQETIKRVKSTPMKPNVFTTKIASISKGMKRKS